MVALNNGNSVFDIRSLTLDEWSYSERIIPPIVNLGTIRSRMAGLCIMPQSFSIRLHSETQVSGRLGMFGGRSTRHGQNPLSGERRKTLSVTHHALSPHPHIIICTSFISSIDYNVFIVLQCHLKDLLCRKVT